MTAAATVLPQEAFVFRDTTVSASGVERKNSSPSVFSVIKRFSQYAYEYEDLRTRPLLRRYQCFVS